MRAKQFFYICAGVLMLAVAYQLGASRADAQLGGEFTGIMPAFDGRGIVAIDASGGIWYRSKNIVCDNSGPPRWESIPYNCGAEQEWWFMGSVQDGMTVPTTEGSWTDVKKGYREEEEE